MMILNEKFYGLMDVPSEGIEFIGENFDWEAACFFQNRLDDLIELQDKVRSFVSHDYKDWNEREQRLKQLNTCTHSMLIFIAEEVDRYLKENDLGELLSTDQYIARFGEETYREQY